MKNQLLKLKKAEGYIGVETMIMAALVVAAGFIAITAVIGDLDLTATGINADLQGKSMDAFVLN